MNNIEQAISELLFEHDCVIIPGFGGFIGNYSPATIIASDHTFLPPFKSILFNIHLRQNDGLLASHLSKKENISYQDALTAIEMMVGFWNRSLNCGNGVKINEIGQLYKDIEGNLQFKQAKEFNYLPASYGFTSFISPSIKREGFQKKLEKKISGYMDTSSGKRRIVPKVLKWAAVLAVPLTATSILGIIHFDKIRTISTNYAGILFPESSKMPVKSKLIVKSFSNKSKNISFKNEVVPVNAKPVKQEVIASTDNSALKPFSIIVGAFRFKENAENLVSDLRQKGYDAAIVGQTKTGLYRVKLTSFSDKEAAIQQLVMVRSADFSGAWLLINKE